MEFKHTSVLLEEVLEGLCIRPDGIYIDGTLGGGGHSYEIASRLTQGGHLIGIDQDEDALAAAAKRLAPFGNRVTFVHDNYENMGNAMQAFFEDGVTEGRVNGILLDLGVSSYQLDNPERGFSYRADAPLDMRMDRSAALSARDIVNDYSAQELTRILRDYGEERMAAKIASNIVRAREEAPLETTGQLVQIIEKSIPMKMREKGLCIITFHSLEDRIVKNAFRRNENPCICPPEFPVCVCGRVSKGKVITRKPILPGKEELEENRRSASAKLRIFEKK